MLEARALPHFRVSTLGLPPFSTLFHLFLENGQTNSRVDIDTSFLRLGLPVSRELVFQFSGKTS